MAMAARLDSLERCLERHLPAAELAEAKRLLFGEPLRWAGGAGPTPLPGGFGGSLRPETAELQAQRLLPGRGGEGGRARGAPAWRGSRGFRLGRP